jgi:hypothetical protein
VHRFLVVACLAVAATFNAGANALYGRTVGEEVRAKGND